ncbi:hypothetical protein PWJ57_06680 [Fructilactobacillus sanfranciscensis]
MKGHEQTMSKIKSITVTNEVQNKPFSGIEFHVQHKKYDRTGHEINHANKEIDFERQKFNQTIVNEKIHLLNGKEFVEYEKKLLTNFFSGKKDENKITGFKPIEQRLIDETINYNLKRTKAGHREEVKHSVTDYVNGRKGIFQKRGIMTLGNQDDWLSTFSNYEKAFKNKDPEAVNEYFNRFNQIFKDYTEAFNQTFGENMKITKAVTNLDEATPHLHYELTMMSRKNGKTSFSLNENVKQARERITGKPAPKDSRANLKWFREKTDNMMIDAVNRTIYAVNRNNTVAYQLKRTGEHTAKNQKIYKDIKEQKKDIEEQQKIANCEIIRDYRPGCVIMYGKKDEQGNEITSEPIKTETGFNAFMKQSLDWLIKVKEQSKKKFREELAKLKKELEKEREAIKQEKQEATKLKNELSIYGGFELGDTIEQKYEYNENLGWYRKIGSGRLSEMPISLDKTKLKPNDFIKYEKRTKTVKGKIIGYSNYDENDNLNNFIIVQNDKGRKEKVVLEQGGSPKLVKKGSDEEREEAISNEIKENKPLSKFPSEAIEQAQARKYEIKRSGHGMSR